MKKIITITLCLFLIISMSACTQSEEKTPTTQAETITEDKKETVMPEEKPEEINTQETETKEEYNSHLTENPVSVSSNSSGGGNSPGSSSYSSDGSNSSGGSSGGGFDIGGDDEVYDYGTVCGTCGGPWDVDANRCWHCNPK